MDSTLTARFDADGFQAFASATQEPEWLLALRREAFEHAEKMQWPERRHEEWIRTDIRAFQLAKYGLPEFSSAPNVGDTSQIHQLIGGVDLGGRMETIDSFVSHQHLDEDLAAKGVIFGSLGDVAASHPELVRQYLFTAFDPDHDKFAALHAAFMSGGQFL